MVRKANIITSLVLIGISLAIMLHSLQLGYHDGEGLPGPGFVPLWAGALIGILALMLLYANTLGNRSDSAKQTVFDKKFARNVAVLIGSSALALALSKLVGMLVAIGLLAGYLSRALGVKKLTTNIAMTVLTPLAFWLVFGMLLEVRFPAGIFGF